MWNSYNTMGVRFYNYKVVSVNSPVMVENLKRVINFFDRSYMKTNSIISYLDALASLTIEYFEVELSGDFNMTYRSTAKIVPEQECVDTIIAILGRDEQSGFIDKEGILYPEAKLFYYTDYQSDENGEPIWGSQVQIPYYMVGNTSVSEYFPSTREYAC